jgi:dipeptidyl aminopeptidase/acylaminoacyl peptidase
MRSEDMGKSLLTTLLLLLSSSTISVPAQTTQPGFDPVPVEIKPVAKTAPRPVSSMDLLTVRDISGIQISPNGKNVAFVVAQAVLDSNSYRTALFVVGTDAGSVPINLGSAGPPQWDRVGQFIKIAPQWSPDSRYITYLMVEKNNRQIWRWRREGGIPEQLTHSADNIESYEWQPDGKQIIFTTVESISAEEIKRVSEQGIFYGSNTGADLWSSIRASENKPMAWAAIEAKPRKKETWIYDLVTRNERRLTPEENAAYGRLHQPPSNVVPGENYVRMSKPSPDGRLIANTTDLHNPTNSSTWTYAISVKDLAGKRSYEVVPPSREFIGSLWWSRESDEIYFTRVTKDRGPTLYAVPSSGGAPRELIKNSNYMLTAFSLDESASRAACLRESPTTPPEVGVVDLTDGVSRTLVNVNPEFQNIKLSPAAKLEWTNEYGDHAFGYLLQPLNYKPGGRYPLIVTTYNASGFLRGAVGDEYPAQVFAANNFAVLCIDLMDAALRIQKPGDFKAAMLRWYSPMASLEQATKSLEEKGIIDPQRKGLTGLSYGAQVTNFTISHSDLFQAAAASSSSYDPISYYLWNNFGRQQFAQLGLAGLPEGTAAERWRELSPALNARRVKAPLLIQVAEREYLPSLQMLVALKEHKKPVELFIYADEGHVKNQPKHKYEVYQRNVDWFNFWLQNKEDPDLTKTEQYKRWRELRKLQQKNASSQ